MPTTLPTLTKDQLIEQAKRLVAAEVKAEDDINRYGDLQKKARLTVVIKAFEVGATFRALQKMPHRMSQQKIATEIGCVQQYVSGRVGLVRYLGADYITNLLTENEKVHSISHYLALLPGLAAADKASTAPTEAAPANDAESTDTAPAPQYGDTPIVTDRGTFSAGPPTAVPDERDTAEPDDEEVEAVLSATESAMEADEQAEANDIRRAIHDAAKARDAVQCLRSSVEALPDHLRPLLRPFVEDIKVRVEEEFDAALLAIEIAEVNNTTK